MQKITVETTIPADVRTVWKHYTEPQSITGWAFASDEWECTHAENDLRVGGKFLTHMQAKDDSAESGTGFDFTGTYTDVVEFERIAYAMDDILATGEGRTCEVLFKDLGNGTTLVTTEFDPEELNSEELQRTGWQSILDNFKKFVVSN